MALRHAVLAALLVGDGGGGGGRSGGGEKDGDGSRDDDSGGRGEYSGYQLAKAFDIGVANFWHALPQQLYAELAKLEAEGLVAGRQVVQETRPNKRLFRVTDAGLAELDAFAAAASKPSFIRDDLLVKVQAVDSVDNGPVIKQLEERAAVAEAKIELFGKVLQKLRGELDEEEFLRRGERVGPYLTCLRGLALERENQEWGLRVAGVLRARRAANAER